MIASTYGSLGDKVPTLGRGDAFAAASGGTDTEVSKTQSTKGYTKLPVVGDIPVGWQTVDYYRDGNTSLYLSRTLDPFPEGPASIRVYGAEKSGQKERDFIPAYTKFIMNGSQEAHQERVQIVETFSDCYVFFYGEKPPIYTYNGFLINSANANWFADFLYYY